METPMKTAEAQDHERGWDFEKAAMPYVDSLYNTAYRMTRNSEDAEDLVQETYLKAYKYYDKFEEGTNFKAWLFKIMKNTFINNYRKKKLTPHKIDFSEIEESYERVIQKNAPDLIKDPETDIFQDMMDEDVKRALDSLPHDYKMVVLLADLEGFSYKEIAEILDCPVGTVMSPLTRYGLPAGVHVWLMMFPPAMIVSAAAGAASVRPTSPATVMATANAGIRRRMDPPRPPHTTVTAMRCADWVGCWVRE